MKGGQADRRLPWPLILLGLAGLTLGILLLTVWREPVLALFLQRERLEALVARLGPAGPLAIIGLQIVQIVLAPVPGQVVGLASGYLYGPWLGTLYSMIGVLLGNTIAVLVSRHWGRPAVERLIDPGTLARVDRLTARLGLPLLLLIYILPFLPGDTITLVAGLTDIPLRSILLAVLCGRLPGIFISAFLGSTATALTARQWIAVIAIVAIAAVLIFRCRASLQRLMWTVVERASAREEKHPDG